MPHVRHVSSLANHPVKNARRPPHHAQRRRIPRQSIVDNAGRRAEAAGRAALLTRQSIWSVVGHNVPMRRSLAGLLFVVAAAALSLAAASWWLERTAFDPDASADAAHDVLADEGIRNQIATLIANAAADEVGIDANELQPYVYELAATKPGAEVLEQVVADAHAKVIGLHDGPVRITPQQMVLLVRDERAAVLRPVRLPINEVRPISIVRQSVHWVIPVMAAVGAVALLAGLVMHPARSDAIFGLGALLVLLGLMAVLVGYLVPVTVVPALSENTWVAAVPQIAKSNAALLFGAAAALIAAGVALVVGAALFRRRRPWSTPVDTSHWNDTRSWR
jgi:hypothetical protein